MDKNNKMQLFVNNNHTIKKEDLMNNKKEQKQSSCKNQKQNASERNSQESK